MFATPDLTNLKPAIFSKKINKGKSILFSNNISLVWDKTKSIDIINILKNIIFNSIDSKKSFYSNSIGQFSFYLWKKNNSFLLWLTNYSGIEQGGYCNKIQKIEINIPKNINKIKIIENYNNSNVSINKNKINMQIIIRNLSIWECINFEYK